MSLLNFIFGSVCLINAEKNTQNFATHQLALYWDANLYICAKLELGATPADKDVFIERPAQHRRSVCICAVVKYAQVQPRMCTQCY